LNNNLVEYPLQVHFPVWNNHKDKIRDPGNTGIQKALFMLLV